MYKNPDETAGAAQSADPFASEIAIDLNSEDGMGAPDKQAEKKQKKESSSWGFLLILFAILLPIRLFVAEPFLVYGDSMQPTFETGDYLIVDELTYRLREPRRGDVIVLKPPYDEKRHFIKRIIGLPGETVIVKGSEVTIINSEHPAGMKLAEPYVTLQSDKESRVTLTSTEYFVAGDNRSVSFDSRSWGPLPAANINGRALFRLYPFPTMSILPGSIKDANYGR
ncbi:MAG TPA: signal peptidase I [Candidatus Paceibacterota bacterium]